MLELCKYPAEVEVVVPYYRTDQYGDTEIQYDPPEPTRVYKLEDGRQVAIIE